MNSLNFKHLMYGDTLNSPNYDVEFAVGLTYSLDLDALLSVPISFGILGDSEDIAKLSPARLMAAIQKSRDKIAIFCNSGKIKVPAKYNAIYSLLEGSVFSVQQEGSFHPKLWAIQEKDNNGNRRIKLVVLSRNLTFNDNLDIVVTLTGNVTKKEKKSPKYKPIVDLLQWTAKSAIKDKNETIKNKIKSLCEYICHVDKFNVSDPFDDYEFYVFNPKLMSDNKRENVLAKMQGNNMIVFSPFISEKTLNSLFKNANKKCLVTCRNWITQGIHDLMKGKDKQSNIYAVNENLLDNANIDLHAKMYFVSTRNENNLYLGSANATYNAFHLNTEILLRLHYKPYKCSFEKFKKAMLGKKEPYVSVEGVFSDGAKKTNNEEIFFNEIIKSIDHAEVKKYAGYYSTTIHFNNDYPSKKHKHISASLAPLQKNCNLKKFSEIPRNIKFSKMSLKDLSEFFILTVGNSPETKIQNVIKIPTDNIPEERNDAISQSIVNTPKKFLDYMSSLLSDQLPDQISNKHKPKTKTAKNEDEQDYQEISLYEDLLRSIYADPNQLKIIESELKILQNKVPDHFMYMFDAFLDAKKDLR